MPRLPGLVVVAVDSVPVDRDRRVAVTVGGRLPVADDKLERRPGAAVMAVAIAVDPDGLRLGLDCLPAVVHQKLIGTGLGLPGPGERVLHRFGIGVLVPADDPEGQRPFRAALA